MLSRCPSCETTFRVTPEQLKAKQGRVRCGSCQHVFNAINTLVDETTSPPLPASQPSFAYAIPEFLLPESARSTPMPPPIADSDGHREVRMTRTDEPMPYAVPTDDQSPTPAIPDDVVILPETLPALKAKVRRSAAPILADDTSPLEPLLHDDGIAPSRWPWAIGIIVALAGMLLQGTYHYRTELATLAPGIKPTLESLCDHFQCTVDLPSKVDLLSIETSDLHPSSANQKSLLELTATLHNRAPFAQSWPHLELTLTDTGDTALARRIIAPSDYLSRGTPQSVGFAGGGEIAVSVFFDAGELTATGYRLYLFYP